MREKINPEVARMNGAAKLSGGRKVSAREIRRMVERGERTGKDPNGGRDDMFRQKHGRRRGL